VIEHAVLRAHQLRSIGPGQRYLVERLWRSDGRVMQRVNDGVPEADREWKEIGRWRDLDLERSAIATQGWVVD